jgi:uncharacterized protein
MACHLLAIAALAIPVPQASPESTMQTLEPVPFHEVEIEDAFWSPRIETTLKVTVGHCLDQCEKTGRIANFDVAAGKVEGGRFRGRLYDDSDLYKVLEGAAYALRHKRDARLEAGLETRVDAVIARIAAAQQEDGYVNCYYTTAAKGKRWTNLRSGHELYCAGHLIEAGLAYSQATGKRQLLEVAIRMADHIDSVFGPGKRQDPPGHQEIELALLALAAETGEPRYARLARFFLAARGRYEARKAGGYGSYAQDHLPVREQRKAYGHAVRAVYQACGLTDLARLDRDVELAKTLTTLWDDVQLGKIYITGGIGSVPGIEGFGPPFVLPNDTAYTETCAAIALSLWNQRMLLLTRDVRYADGLERCLYNGMLSGVSLEGDRFFYDNPLGSRGGHMRSEWFSCACCPSNVVRFLPSLGGRIWAHDEDEIRVSLYISSRTSIGLAAGPVRVQMKSELPWEGKVEIEVNPAKTQKFALVLREPAWCRGRAKLTLAGKPLSLERSEGWLRVDRSWAPGDRIQLTLPMEIERVTDDPRVVTNAGLVALRRGPLVYCLEGVDHKGHARHLVLPADSKLEAVAHPDLLGGIRAIEGPGLARTKEGNSRVVRLRAIPYYAWNHRGPGELVTWIPTRVELAERPGQGIVHRMADRELEASHCYAGDSVAALMDGKLPKSSKGHDIPRMTFWPLKGAVGQLYCRFVEARALASGEVYWFDDGPSGGCRVPASWRLLFKDGESWTPVRPVAGETYGVAKDGFQRLQFAQTKAREWMLEVTMQPGWSTGVLEWRLGKN